MDKKTPSFAGVNNPARRLNAGQSIKENAMPEYNNQPCNPERREVLNSIQFATMSGDVQALVALMASLRELGGEDERE